MLEYLPWSRQTNEVCLEKYRQGTFSCLDIELGGECNYHCAYCDSPDRGKNCSIQIDELEILVQDGKFDWVYVCGLGEPTFNGNYHRFISILKLCQKYNIRCSTFSNLSTLNDELISFIESGTLHILFKYDSNDINMIRALYGIPYVKEQLSNIKKIAQYVRIEDGATNLAASIVPTQLNKIERYIGNDITIIEEFAEWSIQCLLTSIPVESIIQKTKELYGSETVHFFKCDCTEVKSNEDILPTLKIFRDGDLIAEVNGYYENDQFNNLITILQSQV